MTSDFLKQTVDDLISVLCFHGIIVAAVTMDRATENHAWCKWCATHSVDDMVALGICPEEWKDNPLVPSEMRIAFMHPNFDPGNRMLIVIHPDMPHLIKKIVNAMKKSLDEGSKRNLELCGCTIALDMVKEAWIRAGGGLVGQITTSRLKIDHF